MAQCYRWLVLAALIMAAAPKLIVVLLVIAVITSLVALSIKRNGTQSVSLMSNVLLLIASMAISLILFGFATSGVIPVEVQRYVFSILLLAIPVVAAIWLLWRWKRRGFRISLRTLLIGTTSVCLLFGLASWGAFEEFSTFPFDIYVPSPTWLIGIDGLLGIDVFILKPGWLNAVRYWIGGNGLYWMVGLWLTMITVVGLMQNTPSSSPRLKYARLGNIGRVVGSLARPSISLCVVMLVTYLLVAPEVIRVASENDELMLKEVRYPELREVRLKAAVEQLRLKNLGQSPGGPGAER